MRQQPSRITRSAQALLISIVLVPVLLLTLSVAGLEFLSPHGPDPLQTLSLASRRLTDQMFPQSHRYAALTLQTSKTSGPLVVSRLNPRYLADQNGRPVFLAGSNYWNLIQDGGRSNPPPPFDFDQFIAFSAAHGYNYLRSHTWEHSRHTSYAQDWYIRPTIYARKGPGVALDGEPKFDLDTFNPEFFDRLRSRAEKAREHGLYIAIDLFQSFSIADGNTMSNQWRGHPFNGANNINGIDGDPSRQGHGKDVQTLLLPAITGYQRRYVQHVVDTLNDLDNIIWEVAIEPDGSYTHDGQTAFEWMRYFISFLRAYEGGKSNQHPILYSSLYPDGRNPALFASEADLVAPNADGGFDHDAPILGGQKVVLIDTDHIAWMETDGMDWAWKAFTRGAGGFAIMDGGYSDYDDQGGGATYDAAERFRFNLGWIRSFASRLNVSKMIPSTATCSTTYCLSYAGAVDAEHLVYLPPGRTMSAILKHFKVRSSEHPGLSSTYLPPDSMATVDLTSSSGSFSVEWFNPETGELTSGASVAGGGRRDFLAPFPGPAVLHVYSKD